MSSRNRRLVAPFLRLFERITRLTVARMKTSAHHSQQTFTVIGIPPEILVYILQLLPHLELVACRRICKGFKIIIDETSLLQYIIERGAAGYAVGILPADAADALATFRTLQRIYKAPSPTCVATVDLNVTDPGLFQHAWRCWHLAAADVLIGVSTNGNTLGILCLRPSVGNGLRFRLLGTLEPHAIVNDTYLDISQDLLVIVNSRDEITVHSFSTGATHTKSHGIVVESMRLPPEEAGETAYKLAPYGPRFKHPKLYHWPSGKEHSLEIDRGHGSCSLHLGRLTREYALIPFSTRSRDPYIAVFSLGPDSDASPIHRASYALPYHAYYYYHFLPNTVFSPAYTGYDNCECDITILALTGLVGRMIVRTSTFTSNLDKRSNAPYLVVPWSDWGPANTSALPGNKFHIYAITGLRAFTWKEILDFNAYDAAHDLYAPDDTSGPPVAAANHTFTLRCRKRGEQAATSTLERGPYDTLMPFRRVPLQLPEYWGQLRVWVWGLTLTDPEQSPQLCRIMSSRDDTTPEILQYFTLEKNSPSR